MSVYLERPWRAVAPDVPARPGAVDQSTLGEVVDHWVRTTPRAPASHYFDGTTTWEQLDREADALAALLVARGFGPGDRLAICLQNDPAFLVGLVAAWRVGGVAAPLSPMMKADELEQLLLDYEPVALLALDDVYRDVARPLLAGGHTAVRTVVTVSAHDGQSRHDPRVLGGERRMRPSDTVDLAGLVHDRDAFGPVRRHRARPDDVAVVLPTSGTTGSPRGAKLTHANVLFSAGVYRDWGGLVEGEPVLALSPVFHVTGLVAGVATAMLLGSPVVLTHRFEPGVVIDAVRERRPTLAVAAITAYIALSEHPDADREVLSPLRRTWSGGAPVRPETAERIAERLGLDVLNVYGLTESTSPVTMVPPGVPAPVDAETGAGSVGLPVPRTDVRVVDEHGRDVPVRQIGELVVSGPQVISGYWNQGRPNAVSDAGHVFRSGDLGFMDEQGWFYVVDRSNDIINASGFKIWPSEVESVLAAHPDVREAAVVAIADDYRGESAKAFVVLRTGALVTEGDLVEFCRERLAAYKYPREIELVAALPRTATGKVMRSRLRQQGGRPLGTVSGSSSPG
ncbi:MAG: acyl-CoA synthetase [Nocardioides sp.]|nr:acyl-CoA synthetase [Nocardioides sp.]